MIAYIKGILEGKYEDSVVVDHQGIGYEIRLPLSSLAQLRHVGEEVKIHTYLYVREDAMQLYGFLSEDDLQVFKLLLTVNGIGPKGALGILSAITPDELRFAVVTGNDQMISKAPGIGKKTAQKLILDLKDKMKIKDFGGAIGQEISGGAGLSTDADMMTEAAQALVSLGYTLAEANKALKGAEQAGSVEAVIKFGLKQLAKF